ncbi:MULTISPECIES: hypothetical protein [Delftia]|jgi:hypothetical protein|uniref:hypothetical protein n=1 Tax=Delftia TaxID=80865 RepID=UPI000A420A66|nr:MULTISPECIES: hypothetical protein [Delftia]MCB4785150.1 hypothetical protein [Delftia sp. Lp-1]QQB49211.1 hypothetical protein I6H54_23100 [Delftia acidovorans]
MKRILSFFTVGIVFALGCGVGYRVHKIESENIEKFSAIKEMNFSLKNARTPDCLGEIRATEYLFKFCRANFSHEFMMDKDYLNYKDGIYRNDLRFAAKYRMENPIDESYFKSCKGVSLEYRELIMKCWESISHELN